jgi:hypothetical protein
MNACGRKIMGRIAIDHRIMQSAIPASKTDKNSKSGKAPTSVCSI